MSLFLGKIHYWLYSKILWFENIENDIVSWAKEAGLPVEDWSERIYDEYGAPTGGKSLEEIIDTSNIHGWLQDRITSAELRQAALITQILNSSPEFKADLVNIFTAQGEAAAREYDGKPEAPDEIYNALNDFILEGMPCDRVNEIVASNENEFSWETTTCLHTPYWDMVKGDVRNFYMLRESWVEAFVRTINPDFKYEKSPEGINKIVRR